MFGGEPRVVEAANGVQVLIAGSREGGEDALFEGFLAILQGGCLGLTQTAGGSPSEPVAEGTVIVWPGGTEVLDDDEVGIRMPGGREFALGDPVSLGGGVLIQGSDDAPDIPAGCSEYVVAIVGEVLDSAS